MHQHFIAELDSFEQLIKQFVKAHPTYSGLLDLANNASTDPYIARLIEGVAFLTAQIRQQLNETLPNVYENLLHHLAPHLLLPIPSFTILQFSLISPAHQQKYLITQGTQITSDQIDTKKISCVFQTCHDLNIYPIIIKNCTIDHNKAGTTSFTVEITTKNNQELKTLMLDKISFYIHANWQIANYICYALLSSENKINIYCNEKNLSHSDIKIVSTYLAETSESLIQTEGTFSAFEHLREYFCFPYKGLFIDIINLDKITWPTGSYNFNIEIQTTTSFSDYQSIPTDFLQLNCIPAVNIFKTDAEPILYDFKKHTYPIFLINKEPSNVALYDIHQVTATYANQNNSITIPPITSGNYLTNNQSYYVVQSQNLSDIKTTYSLTLANIDEKCPLIVSCEINAYNQNYPNQYINENSVFRMKNTSINNFLIKNLLRPTICANFAKRKDFLWQLIGYLTINIGSIDTADKLKKLLELYNWNNDFSNQQKINAIMKVNTTKTYRIYHGSTIHGILYSIAIEESGFSSIANIYLFGMILKLILANYVNFNSFIDLLITTYPSKKELKWLSTIDLMN